MHAAYLIGLVLGALIHLAGFAIGWHARGRVELLAATNSTAGDDGSVGP